MKILYFSPRIFEYEVITRVYVGRFGASVNSSRGSEFYIFQYKSSRKLSGKLDLQPKRVA